MSENLYDTDVLAWSEQQADLIRRLGRGERVNGVDWENVAEEIESVGLSELHSVQSFLDQILMHLLKINAWPTSDAVNHWEGEVEGFQEEATRRFVPSMRPRINVARQYSKAMKRSKRIVPAERWAHWPVDCPFTLDDLMNGEVDQLLERLTGHQRDRSAPPA